MENGKIINLVWPDLDFIDSIAQNSDALKLIFKSHSSIIIESGRSLLLESFNAILTQKNTKILNIFVPYIHNAEKEEIKNTIEDIYSVHTKIKISWFLWKGFSNINITDIDSRIKEFEIEKKTNTDRNITSQYCLTKAFLGDAKTATFDTKGLKNSILVCILDNIAKELGINKPEIKVKSFFKNNKPAIEGVSAPIKKIKTQIHRVSKTNLNVLLSGESGSGKEAAAFFIHDLSAAQDKKFIAMNCALFEEKFLISELFGHTQGAFTGAIEKKGIIADLKEGTLFLDELPEMSKPCQAMLLRFLEDGVIRPMGSLKEDGPYKNIRIIGAGQPDRIKENLRSDLLFRIGEKKIDIPPLRDIVDEDLFSLIDHLLYKNSNDPKERYEAKRFFKQNRSLLKEYSWPGNVRELAAFVKRRLQMGKEEEKDIIEDIKSSGEEKKESVQILTQDHQDFDLEFKSLIQKYAARIPKEPGKHQYPKLLPFLENLKLSYTYYVSEELENKKNQNQICYLLDLSATTRKKYLREFLAEKEKER